MKKIEKELNKVKFTSFGKVKLRNKPKVCKDLEELQKEKIESYENEIGNNVREDKIKDIDDKMAEKLLSEQKKNFEKELKNLKTLGATKCKSAMVFNLKNKVVVRLKLNKKLQL